MNKSPFKLQLRCIEKVCIHVSGPRCYKVLSNDWTQPCMEGPPGTRVVRAAGRIEDSALSRGVPWFHFCSSVCLSSVGSTENIQQLLESKYRHFTVLLKGTDLSVQSQFWGKLLSLIRHSLCISYSHCRPLPHGIRPETSEVCLFTKDEPNLSAEQTENLYKKILLRNGIRSISRVREVLDGIVQYCNFFPFIPPKRVHVVVLFCCLVFLFSFTFSSKIFSDFLNCGVSKMLSLLRTISSV